MRKYDREPTCAEDMPDLRPDGTPYRNSKQHRWKLRLARLAKNPMDDPAVKAKHLANKQRPELRESMRGDRNVMARPEVAAAHKAAVPRGENHMWFGQTPISNHEDIEWGEVYLAACPGVEGFKLGFSTNSCRRIIKHQRRGFSNWLPPSKRTHLVYVLPCRWPFHVEQDALAKLDAANERVFDLVAAVRTLQESAETFARR